MILLSSGWGQSCSCHLVWCWFYSLCQEQHSPLLIWELFYALRLSLSLFYSVKSFFSGISWQSLFTLCAYLYVNIVLYFIYLTHLPLARSCFSTGKYYILPREVYHNPRVGAGEGVCPVKIWLTRRTQPHYQNSHSIFNLFQNFKWPLRKVWDIIFIKIGH